MVLQRAAPCARTFWDRGTVMIGFVYEYGLIVAAFAAFAVIAWLLVGRWIAGRSSDGPAWDPSDPWEGTSPAEEGATLDLTPTELLPGRVLRPAEVVPDAEALRADVAHYIDAHLDPVLAEPRAALDRLYRSWWAEIPTGLYPTVPRPVSALIRSHTAARHLEDAA